MIEAVPEPLFELFDFMEKECGEAFNHLIFTLYPSGHYGIGAHSDKSFSKEAAGKFEGKATIADLSIGATRKFMFVTSEVPDGTETVAELQDNCVASLALTHGAYFAFKGELNVALKHAVPHELEVDTARISMVFRRADNKFVHPTGNLYRGAKDKDWKPLKRGKETVKFRRQYVVRSPPQEEDRPEAEAEEPEAEEPEAEEVPYF